MLLHYKSNLVLNLSSCHNGNLFTVFYAAKAPCGPSQRRGHAALGMGEKLLVKAPLVASLIMSRRELGPLYYPTMG